MLDEGQDLQRINEKTLSINERCAILQQELTNPLSLINIEQFFDILIALNTECKESASSLNNEFINNFHQRFNSVASRLCILRRNVDDFFIISKIGRGAFGKVHLVRDKTSGRVVAMKTMRKTTIIAHRADFWAEREIMAKSNSPWIVKLYYSFQDKDCLYMIMEFVPGGNLVSWMDEVEVLSEAACRFYAAEVALALSHLHSMGFIHRDLKPDNLLLDAGGHLKLADFGTAIKVDPIKKTVVCDTAVGTPDYISPEVLLSQSNNCGEYSFEVDWWALGVLVYEMLYAETPFYSETLVNTYSNIMKYSRHLSFPSDVQVSDTAIDFIKNLLCDNTQRLGNFPRDSSRNIFDHSWFSSDWVDSQRLKNSLEPNDLEYISWDWNNIRATVTPFQPQLSSETDTAYFGFCDQEKGSLQTSITDSAEDSITSNDCPENNPAENANNNFSPASSSSSPFQGNQLNFAGFSFTQKFLSESLTEFEERYRLKSSHKQNADTAKSQGDSIIDTEQSSTDKYSDLDQKDLLVNTYNGDLSVEGYNTLRLAVSRLQTQLEEQLQINEENMHEIIRLSELLQISENSRMSAESELASREVAAKEAAESSERYMSTMKSEFSAQIQRLENELKRWQDMAKCDEHTKRLIVDSNILTSKMSVSDPKVSFTPVNNENTNVLIERLRQLNERLQRSEAMKRDAEEQFEAEKGFTRLYKDACAEKSDQLAEMARQLANIKDNLETANQSMNRLKRENEATKRALAEEQENVKVWQSKAKNHEDSCNAAKKRAAIATEDVTKHCTRINQLEEELSMTNKAVAAEKVKCAAAVDKIRQILSGQNHEVIELMMNSDLPNASSSENLNSTSVTDSNTTNHKFLRTGENSHILKQIERNNKKYSNQLQQIQLRHQNQMKELQQKYENVQGRLLKTEADLAKSKEEMKRVKQENSILQKHQIPPQQQQQQGPSESQQIRDLLPVTNRSASSGLIKIKSSLSNTKSSISYSNMNTNNSNSPDNPDNMIMNQSTDTFEEGQIIPDVSSNSGKSANAGQANDLQRRSSFSERPICAVTSNFTRNLSTKSVNSSAMLFLASHYEEIFTQRLKNQSAILTIGGLQINIAGLLQLPSKERGRRKKLSWHTKFVILTQTDLMIYDLINASGNVDPNINPRSKQNFTLSDECLSLPLTGILHLRNVTSCDVLHATADDLPKIFQIIYDQTAAIKKMNHHLDKLPIKTKQKSTTLQFSSTTDGSNQSINASPLIRSNQSNARCNSHTLPRKMNFFDYSSLSSSLKSATTSASNLIAGNKSNNLSKEDISLPLTRSDYSSKPSLSKQQTSESAFQITAPANQSTQHTTNTVTSSDTSNTSKGSLLLQGHVLQKIQFRSPVMCDLCHKACWSVISPPQVYQCLHCQTKMHSTHLEKRDFPLPQCAKSTAIKLLKTESEEMKNHWFIAISIALDELRKQSSNSSLANKSTK